MSSTTRRTRPLPAYSRARSQTRPRRRLPGRIAGPVAAAAALPLGWMAVPASSNSAAHPFRVAAALAAAHQVAEGAYSPGEVAGYGNVSSYGGPGSNTAKPLIGIAATPSGSGYWLAAADGGIFAFGDATYQGSLGSTHLAAPIVAIAPTPSGAGYWLAAADGGIFAFGDATYHGSLSPERAGTNVVSMAAAPKGSGYWLATAPPPPPPAQSSPQGTPLGVFEVTCYDMSGTTASGAQTSSDTVAVDPSVIPMGSTIYIDGVGQRVAQDTGGAIQGHRLDIWEPSYQDCADWGVQDRQVWSQG